MKSALVHLLRFSLMGSLLLSGCTEEHPRSRASERQTYTEARRRTSKADGSDVDVEADVVLRKRDDRQTSTPRSVKAFGSPFLVEFVAYSDVGISETSALVSLRRPNKTSVALCRVDLSNSEKHSRICVTRNWFVGSGDYVVEIEFLPRNSLQIVGQRLGIFPRKISGGIYLDEGTSSVELDVDLYRARHPSVSAWIRVEPPPGIRLVPRSIEELNNRMKMPDGAGMRESLVFVLHNETDLAFIHLYQDGGFIGELQKQIDGYPALYENQGGVCVHGSQEKTIRQHSSVIVHNQGQESFGVLRSGNYRFIINLRDPEAPIVEKHGVFFIRRSYCAEYRFSY